MVFASSSDVAVLYACPSCVSACRLSRAFSVIFVCRVIFGVHVRALLLGRFVLACVECVGDLQSAEEWFVCVCVMAWRRL